MILIMKSRISNGDSNSSLPPTQAAGASRKPANRKSIQ